MRALKGVLVEKSSFFANQFSVDVVGITPHI